MRNSPLVISLLIGLIVVLVIGGVSLLVKVNFLSSVYKKEVAKVIRLEKKIEDLNKENINLHEEKVSLKEKVKELNTQIEELNTEIKKLEKLKEKLEENLKEELMRKEKSIKEE